MVKINYKLKRTFLTKEPVDWSSKMTFCNILTINLDIRIGGIFFPFISFTDLKKILFSYNSTHCFD